MSDLTTGVVVRGLTATTGAFDKDPVDGDDRLQDASVNAVQGVGDRQRAAAGMDQDNFKGGFAATTVEKIVAKGGRVREDPQRGNDHHCQIFGLSRKDANNLFSNHLPWNQL